MDKNIGYDFIIIDTPPLNEDIINSAIKVANLVIIPTSPSSIEISRVFELVENTDKNTKYRVLITMADIRTNSFKYIKELLKEEKIKYFDNYIRVSEEVRKAYSSLPKNKNDYEELAKEIRGILNE